MKTRGQNPFSFYLLPSSDLKNKTKTHLTSSPFAAGFSPEIRKEVVSLADCFLPFEALTLARAAAAIVWPEENPRGSQRSPADLFQEGSRSFIFSLLNSLPHCTSGGPRAWHFCIENPLGAKDDVKGSRYFITEGHYCAALCHPPPQKKQN